MRGRLRVSDGRSRRTLRRLIVLGVVALAVAAVISLSSTARANAQPAPLDGIPTNCPSIDIGITDIPDGGWTWVDPAQPIQQATGVVNQTTELDPFGEDPSTLSS